MKIEKIEIKGNSAKKIEKISKDKSKRNTVSSNQIRLDLKKFPVVE